MARIIDVIRTSLIVIGLGGSTILAVPARALDLDAIKANIARYKAVPEFVAPGPPFDAKACMKDKKILTVPFASQIPFVATVVTDMVELGKEIGFRYDEYKNTGQRSQWIQGISQGINQHYNLIDLFAPDLLSLVPQAKEAQAAGIPIVASHDGGYEQLRPEPFLSVPADYFTAGKLLAQWAIMRTDGKANVLVVTALDSYSSESIINGIKDGFKDCETCKVAFTNVAVADWATRIQPTVQAALVGNPDLNFILPTYDPMTQFIVPAIELTQTGNRVKVASFNGTPFALDLVREGKLDMIVAESLDWVAHGVVDAEMRILCGQHAIKDPKVPLRIFDASNVADAGVPAKSSTGFGDSYKDGYRKLWELK
jgi:ribose transport system substrate-binding protein